ncbi:M23 family metallopeptidase [Treponema primitia]|uniref:M23 family metallopeptidase n=1 Tax=Treponema primitia TaxID=88058 RepID=UPI0002554C92|nr:M23 family metallopeptidase [Treponema primitia]
MNLRFRFSWLILVVSAVLAAVVFPAKLPAEETIHIVQGGDTIYSLARTYGVNFQEILNLNGIDNAGRIRVGQRIRIPGTASVSSIDHRVTDHRVTRGETLYGIARQYGVSMQTLLSANGLSERYTLKIGDVLHIPQTGSPGPVLSGPVPIIPPIETITGTEIRSTVSRTIDMSVPWPIVAREMAYMTGKLNGVVLLGERNEPVKSLTQGVVISAGPYRGFGKVTIIQVTGGYLYVYGGCESLSVREGDRVNPGTELGRLGMDALSEKPQLFFLVYQNNVSVDPAAAPRS